MQIPIETVYQILGKYVFENEYKIAQLEQMLREKDESASETKETIIETNEDNS